MNKQKEATWYPESKVYCDGEVVMVLGSTQPEIKVEVWSGKWLLGSGSALDLEIWV